MKISVEACGPGNLKESKTMELDESQRPRHEDQAENLSAQIWLDMSQELSFSKAIDKEAFDNDTAVNTVETEKAAWKNYTKELINLDDEYSHKVLETMTLSNGAALTVKSQDKFNDPEIICDFASGTSLQISNWNLLLKTASGENLDFLTSTANAEMHLASGEKLNYWQNITGEMVFQLQSTQGELLNLSFNPSAKDKEFKLLSSTLSVSEGRRTGRHDDTLEIDSKGIKAFESNFNPGPFSWADVPSNRTESRLARESTAKMIPDLPEGYKFESGEFGDPGHILGPGFFQKVSLPDGSSFTLTRAHKYGGPGENLSFEFAGLVLESHSSETLHLSKAGSKYIKSSDSPLHLPGGTAKYELNADAGLRVSYSPGLNGEKNYQLKTAAGKTVKWEISPGGTTKITDHLGAVLKAENGHLARWVPYRQTRQ